MALSAPQAAAQLPAICDQYPDLPQCQDEPGGGDQPTDDDAGPTDEPEGTTDEGGPSAADTAGKLPFTGYPLTALVLLLLALLAVGLTLRTYVAVRERIARTNR